LIASGAIIISIAIGRPEPMLIGVPFVVVLAAAGLVGRMHPYLDVRLTVERARAVEGDELDFAVEVVTASSGHFEVAYSMDLPAGLDLIEAPVAVMVSAGAPATMHGRIRCRRWGARTLGGGRILARDPVSAFVYERAIEPTLELRVYPQPERLRSLLRPLTLRPRFGSLVSRAAGVGLEFADIREFVPGDEQRHVNWKATARRSRIHVNLFHPERSADIVLVLDTFTDVAGEKVSSLDLAVRGATSAALECLRQRDRVGLLTIGGTIQWLLPGMGVRQLYRIVDSLMQTQLAFTYAWPNLNAIPKRVVPPAALVIALTPLADRRTPVILLDLHSRGHDIAVVEISSGALLPAPRGERERLAQRLWTLHREAIRFQYRQIGLPVSAWEPDQPLQIPFLELQRFRRTSRRAHA
jgi:uncharacterized protein (DUF58 family)